MANTNRTNRKSWLDTIKRWFGMKAEQANDSMDGMIDVEVQLNRKLRELREKRENILTNETLAKALGLPAQMEEEMLREQRSYGQAKYEATIKSLVSGGNEAKAKQILMDKKKHEEKLTRMKENYKTAQNNRDKIQSDLDMLDIKIEKAKNDLEELKQRNRYAEQTEQVYDLMNDISSIDVGYDSEGIEELVQERERQSAGKRVLHDRANTVSNAQHEAMMSSLDDELANYR